MIDRLAISGRRLIFGLAVLGALLLVASPALAQTYTPTPVQNVLELNTNTPGPGGGFTGRGCGFQPGASVSATIGGSQVAVFTAGSDGCAVGSMIAPNQPGTFTVCYTGLTSTGASQQLCNTITVSVGQATTTVPFTGTKNLIYVAIAGVLLVIVGAGIIVTFRRRRLPA